MPTTPQEETTMKIITVNGMTIQQRISKLLRDVEKKRYQRVDKIEYVKSCIESILEKSVFIDGKELA
jgi:hypothetical protein